MSGMDQQLNESRRSTLADKIAGIKQRLREANEGFERADWGGHDYHVNRSLFNDAIDLIADLECENERLVEIADPAIARRQLPNGSVPSNGREAAEGWCDAYQRLEGLLHTTEELCEEYRIAGDGTAKLLIAVQTQLAAAQEREGKLRETLQRIYDDGMDIGGDACFLLARAALAEEEKG